MNHPADPGHDPDHKHDVTIIVNGRQKTVRHNPISFEELVLLAFPQAKPNAAYTITYSNGPKQNREGSMSAGDKVHIKNEMVFNVTETDKS